VVTTDAKDLYVLMLPVTIKLDKYLTDADTECIPEPGNGEASTRPTIPWSQDRFKAGTFYPQAVRQTPHGTPLLQQIRRNALKERSEPLNKTEQNLIEAKASVLALWQSSQLETRLRRLCSYRDHLNSRLNDILNTTTGGSGIDPSTPATEDRSIADFSNAPHNDIVEVVAINRTLQTGLQNIAAIFTKHNGDTLILTPPAAAKHSAKEYTDGNVIRYDLQTKSTGCGESLDPLIKAMPDFVERIKSILHFDEANNRRIAVKDAHKKTFRWILRDSKDVKASCLATWLKNGSHCFWINGKAGSGKSTLMKYIHEQGALRRLLNSWSGRRQLIVATFFFWAAGQSLQKSYEGILRSLLSQILDARASLAPTIFPRLTRHLLCGGVFEDLDISLQELQDAVLLLAKEMPDDLTVFLMIDGVDEYSGDHFDFSKFLVQLAGCSSVKILVSSRPIPACYHIFSRFPSIRLQDLTVNDIRAYIDAELLSDDLLIEMDTLENGFAQEVKKALTEKSSGVFLWIVIVVKKLLIGLGEYDDRDTLMAKIDELPSDLEELYDHMFSKMSKEYQKEVSQLLQLVCHAQASQGTALSAIQLYLAIQGHHNISSAPADISYSEQDETLRVKRIEGKLRSRCCGLIEVLYVGVDGPLKEPKVDFLHRTVYDYINDPLVWKRVTEMHQMTSSDRDLALLAACAHIIQRRALFGLKSTPSHECTKELLATCLEYGELLDDAGNVAFLPYLTAADATHLQCCQKLAPLWAPHHYEEAYILFAKSRCYNEPYVNEMIKQQADLDTFSALTATQLAPPAYFEQKVKAQPWTRSLLLLHLLNMYRTIFPEPTYTRRYLRNIETLFKYNVDTNATAAYLYENKSASKSLFQIAASLAGPGSKAITPWHYWIAGPVRTEKPEFVEITLLLIRGGASIDASAKIQRAALADLYTTLIFTREILVDESIEAMLDECVAALEPALRATDPKIEYVPGVEDDAQGSASPGKMHRGDA